MFRFPIKHIQLVLSYEMRYFSSFYVSFELSMFLKLSKNEVLKVIEKPLANTVMVTPIELVRDFAFNFFDERRSIDIGSGAILAFIVV